MEQKGKYVEEKKIAFFIVACKTAAIPSGQFRFFLKRSNFHKFFFCSIIARDDAVDFMSSQSDCRRETDHHFVAKMTTKRIIVSKVIDLHLMSVITSLLLALIESTCQESAQSDS